MLYKTIIGEVALSIDMLYRPDSTAWSSTQNSDLFKSKGDCSQILSSLELYRIGIKYHVM